MTTELISKMDVYWITRFDYIHNLAAILIILSFVFLGVLNIALCNDKVKYKVIHYFLNVLGFFVLFLGLLAVTFVPSTKEMIAIHIIPKVANSDFIQNDLPKEAKEMYGVAKSYLKEKLTVKKKKQEEE